MTDSEYKQHLEYSKLLVDMYWQKFEDFQVKHHSLSKIGQWKKRWGLEEFCKAA